MIVGPDGAPWITDGGLNAIVRVDPRTSAVRAFRLPASTGDANLNTAVFDRAGVLWFTGQSGIYGRLNPRTGAMKVFRAPRGRGPYGITAARDGFVYYASLAGSYLGRIDRAHGARDRAPAADPRPGRAPRVGGLPRPHLGERVERGQGRRGTTRARGAGASGGSPARIRSRTRSTSTAATSSG